MKNKITLMLLSCFFVLNGFAQKQKVTVDENLIKVDGVDYAVLEKIGPKMGSDFRLKSLDGKDLVNFQFLEYNNPNKANSSNPKGRVTYYEVTFLGDGQKCEVDGTGAKKNLARIIVENKLIKGNEVDAEAAKTFVMINGAKFSEEKKSMNGNVIIINR